MGADETKEGICSSNHRSSSWVAQEAEGYMCDDWKELVIEAIEGKVQSLSESTQ